MFVFDKTRVQILQQLFKRKSWILSWWADKLTCCPCLKRKLTSGSDSSVLGGGVSLGGFFSSLGAPILGGGRWNSLDWSCCALGQGRVPLTHSTGSSHTALCPWTWGPDRNMCKMWGVKEASSCCYHWVMPFAGCLCVCVCVFTLMPSLAPSWRYGMMEWFHRSINHCLNSATDTGHERKKQGPGGGRYFCNCC